MLLTVTLNCFCGLLIAKTQNNAQRTLCTIAGVASSLGFLFCFKHFGFFSDLVLSLLGRKNPSAKLFCLSVFHLYLPGVDLYGGCIPQKGTAANTCGVIVEKILESSTLSVAGGWLMAVAYAFQIYFDFSADSDMGISMGGMFGFHFFENFN